MSDSRPLVVLGATGSIGTQTLEVADALGRDVVAVAAGSDTPALRAILADRPHLEVVVASTGDASALARDVANRVEGGPGAVAELAGRPHHVVVNGIVGSAGLAATLAALRAGNRVGLANKESMVAGGELVTRALVAGGGELIPIDSEHSALHQCLLGERAEDVARLVLTASGGPFRGRSRASLGEVTASDALAHPTWDMGGRITIDSATLFNKGFEVIEAHHLFGISFDRIDVVVHPQSIVHSAVEFVDGALKAHVGHPDMRVPIQYALTYPHRGPAPGAPFRLAGTTLEFEDPDRSVFPALDLAFEAGVAGGSAPAVLNAADEIAVGAFLAGHIGFLAITDVVAETVEAVRWRPITSFDDVVEADAEARQTARTLVGDAADSVRGKVV